MHPMFVKLLIETGIEAMAVMAGLSVITTVGLMGLPQVTPSPQAKRHQRTPTWKRWAGQDKHDQMRHDG